MILGWVEVRWARVEASWGGVEASSVGLDVWWDEVELDGVGWRLGGVDGGYVLWAEARWVG